MKRILLLLSICFVASSIFAQNGVIVSNPFPKTITVLGSAEMEVIPDEIFVQIDLKEYKKKGEDKVELEKIKADFLNNCKVLSIADSNISVSSYDGYNMSNIWKRRKKEPDLMASIIYQIKFSNTKQIDALVEKLDDQATSNFAVVSTSHSKIREYRKQLKIQAIKAAKLKAKYLAEAIDEDVGQAVTIDEPQEYASTNVANGVPNYSKGYSNAYSFKKSYNGYEEGNDGGVEYKKIRLKYDVKVVFALK